MGKMSLHNLFILFGYTLLPLGECEPVFFTCAPTRLARLAFIGEEFSFAKVGVTTYFILF